MRIPRFLGKGFILEVEKEKLLSLVLVLQRKAHSTVRNVSTRINYTVYNLCTVQKP